MELLVIFYVARLRDMNAISPNQRFSLQPSEDDGRQSCKDECFATVHPIF